MQKTRKRLLMILMVLGVCLSAGAQYTLMINGTPFVVKCDAKTRTAEIIDEKYKPDENRYPFRTQDREFKDMKHNKNKVVDIPSEIQAFGKTYRITKIGRCAFADYQEIKTIYIPNTVEEIDEYAFFRCSAEEIQVPPSVRRIGKRAFGYCSQLRVLSLPSQIDYMGERCYSESKRVMITRTAEEDYDEVTNDLVAENVPRMDLSKHEKASETNVSKSKVDIDIPLNPTNNHNTYALIFANEDYENEAKVDFAGNDGVSFRDYCQQTLGIPSENIHFRKNATLGKLITEVGWLTNLDTKDATVLVYYAGHGIPDEESGSTYLLPVDGSSLNSMTGYSLSKLYQQLNNLEASRVVVFLDACFSGTKRDETQLTAARGIALRPPKAQDPQGKVIVFSATQDDQTAHSYDEQEHGMFTYFLLDKLQTSNGDATLGELAEYVHNNVEAISRKKHSKVQTPTVNVGNSFSSTWHSMRLR